MTDEELTALYNAANNITGGKNPPISTARIFAAMRRAAAIEREACAKLCLEKHANGNWKYDTRDECHDAIRARSKT